MNTAPKTVPQSMVPCLPHECVGSLSILSDATSTVETALAALSALARLVVTMTVYANVSNVCRVEQISEISLARARLICERSGHHGIISIAQYKHSFCLLPYKVILYIKRLSRFASECKVQDNEQRRDHHIIHSGQRMLTQGRIVRIADTCITSHVRLRCIAQIPR